VYGLDPVPRQSTTLSRHAGGAMCRCLTALWQLTAEDPDVYGLGSKHR
jgi:hypothetical protein